MEFFIGIGIVGFLIALLFFPLVYFTRRSSDIRLLGDSIELHYPMRKKEIYLNQELKSWNLQEARFLWIGQVYSINIELESGKWHHVNTRFNRETFEKIYTYLDTTYSDRRKKDK
ncbi:hypothetical protein M3O96_07130 [Aquiflexum sp. TKW24L]|uniref:hypothetical protein n=1 Tax=Aquiflexum sp. TKW24L TaxID=2942212 RepID=UPI0020C12AFF|nr:hypothetical protein [Aquiflexum sp. TKW24L]MCL6258851.1 hypothetical protein [Aquiflexum sp. TKW24L]